MEEYHLLFVVRDNDAVFPGTAGGLATVAGTEWEGGRGVLAKLGTKMVTGEGR
jgi:hypothetical protein